MNFSAGAEVGIYSRPAWLTKDPDLDQYYTDYNLAMPMKLYLYNYSKTEPMEQLVAWEPTEKQWWITGFNPYYSSTDSIIENDIDVKKQVMICSVDFSQYTDSAGNNKMYKNFKTKVLNEDTISKFVLFDDSAFEIWLCWCEVNLL